jgi:hypothetical protein
MVERGGKWKQLLGSSNIDLNVQGGGYSVTKLGGMDFPVGVHISGKPSSSNP